MMAPHAILDSHVHLWPEGEANTTSHTWMTPGHILAKQYSVDEYLQAAARGGAKPSSVTQSDTTARPSQTTLLGVIYIETDRAVPAPSPELSTTARWTHPLAELAWLRRLVDGTPNDDEGHTAAHSPLIAGLVPWAPVNEGAEVTQKYLTAAEEVLGEEAWRRVRGWRFLLQDLREQEEFEGVVFGARFAEGLRTLWEERECVFEVGVDQYRGGIWQLEGMVRCIEEMREEGNGSEGMTFVLNHLCKPNFADIHFPDWARTMQRLAALPNVYMKLSGCFSEAPPSKPFSAPAYYKQVRPWIGTILKLFTPRRVMFGSDWPVCTIGGPGEAGWAGWKDVVECALAVEDVSEEDQEWIWWRTAVMAYRLGST